jgi:hypothetical protein
MGHLTLETDIVGTVERINNAKVQFSRTPLSDLIIDTTRGTAPGFLDAVIAMYRQSRASNSEPIADIVVPKNFSYEQRLLGQTVRVQQKGIESDTGVTICLHTKITVLNAPKSSRDILYREFSYMA